MRVENQGPGPSKDHILQIEQGGTSAATNEQALRNLGAIAVEEINKPNGIAGYEFGTTKVPEYILPSITGGGNSPTIEGPMSVTLGDSAILKITNFDSFTDYVVSYHRFTGQRDGDTIFITASSYGNDGNVTVNGSVFNINVTIANPPLLGEVVFREATPDQVTDLKNTDTVGNVLVARAAKEFVGSLSAGEVQLYQRNGDTGLVSQHILSPAILDTTITYTGQGAKKFTANNQVFNRTGNGSITFTGAGNILIEAVGDTITTPTVPPQGLPQYPNGLPPYVPGTSSEVPTSNFYYSNDAAQPPGRYVLSSGQVVYCERYSAIGPDATICYFYNTTTTPAQGNPSYPSGLPPYNPGSPASTTTATLTFTANTFQVSGTAVNRMVYPFKNYQLGQAITVAENGTYASGQTLETTERLGLGGEVIVIHNDGTRKKQHLNVAYSAPHPRFGASVKLKSDASHLLVGSPGINRVSLYRNVSNNFEQPTLTTPSGIATTARFGERIEATDTFSRVFVYAPGEETNGAVYIYSMSSNALTFIEKMTLPTLPNGFKPAMDMRSVADINKLYFNAYNSTTQTYVVVEFTRVAGLWNVTETFDNPNPGTPDLFGSHYSVSEDGRVVAISSIGDSGMKGVLNIWVNVDGEWIFFDSVIDEEAEFGDQFGKFISLATNGKNAVTIHRRDDGSDGDDILYLK